MALKTDIKKTVQEHTKLKVRSISANFWVPKITDNKRWKIYTIEVWVKNDLEIND